MDNSSLSRYSISTETIENDFYKKANPGHRLGDLGSDIFIWKDIALISVTGTATIEKIDKVTGKSLGRLTFEQGRAPRKLVVINDSLAAVTDLFNHSICFFNPYSLEVIKDKVATGPAPEGIALAADLLFVVNSGYGDYLADRPKAGTVSVIDISTMSEAAYFYVAPNPIEILVNNELNKFYVSYNHLPSLVDSVGGIIEFDLTSFKELRRMTTQVRSMCFSSGKDSLFFIGESGVEMIDLSADKFTSKLVISNSKQNDIWYSLAIDSYNYVWVGNAGNYQISGELLKFDLRNTALPVSTYITGVNPNKILFY